MSFSAQLLALPQWLAVVLLVAIAVSFSIVGFLIVHRFIPVQVRQIHNDVAGFVFATLGVTYGVLLAFVVIVVWQQYYDAEENVANESSTALVLYKNIVAYPDKKASNAMQDGFLGYIRQAVGEKDTLLTERSFEGQEASINQVLSLIDNIVPDSEHEQILYTQILQNLNDLVKYRSLRHQAAHEELPSAIWLALIVGAAVTIGFTFLFGTENVWAHVIMMSLLAALIAVVIYVVIEMDHPATGAVNIGFPNSYSSILDIAKAPR